MLPATALEASKHGIDCVVLEAAELGFGASTRNEGGVSGGVNIGKSFSGKTLDPESDRARAVLMDGADAFSLIERLIAEEGIACHWNKTGRFVGTRTPAHYASQAKKIAMLNDAARSEAHMVPRDRQHEEMASDYYYGRLVVERSAILDAYPNLAAYVARGEARPAYTRAFDAQLAVYAGKSPTG